MTLEQLQNRKTIIEAWALSTSCVTIAMQLINLSEYDSELNGAPVILTGGEGD